MSDLMRPSPAQVVRDWVGAQKAGELRTSATHRDRTGLPVDGFDAQIAAICQAHDAVLATRNVKDFRETGIGLIDPCQPVP